MRLALGNYVNILNDFDTLCLTDTSSDFILNTFPHIKNNIMKYIQQYGKRVFNMSLKDAKTKIIYTPFDKPIDTCKQLSEIVSNYNLKSVLIPMPKNYESISQTLFENLDDRFVVITDDDKYLGYSTSAITSKSEFPDTDTTNFMTPTTVANYSSTDNSSTTTAQFNHENSVSNAPSDTHTTIPVATPFVNTQTKGLTVCFTGHRPKDLFGHQDVSKYAPLQNSIYKCIDNFYNSYNVRRFISGGAQGVDMLSFFVVEYLKQSHNDIANDLYIPFVDHDAKMLEKGIFSKSEYAKMVDKATSSKIVFPNIRSGAPKGEIVSALYGRNIAMVDDSDFVLGVYGGNLNYIVASNCNVGGGTLHCLRYAFSQNKKIVIINPQTDQIYKLNF